MMGKDIGIKVVGLLQFLLNKRILIPGEFGVYCTTRIEVCIDSNQAPFRNTIPVYNRINYVVIIVGENDLHCQRTLVLEQDLLTHGSNGNTAAIRADYDEADSGVVQLTNLATTSYLKFLGNHKKEKIRPTLIKHNFFVMNEVRLGCLDLKGNGERQRPGRGGIVSPAARPDICHGINPIMLERWTTKGCSALIGVADGLLAHNYNFVFTFSAWFTILRQYAHLRATGSNKSFAKYRTMKCYPALDLRMSHNYVYLNI